MRILFTKQTNEQTFAFLELLTEPTAFFHSAFNKVFTSSDMRTGVFLLLPLLTLGDPDRDGKRGFRERIRCIDNGKFYRNPNTPKELAFRKVPYVFFIG